MAKKFGFVKAGKTQANLNSQMHKDIGDAFRKVYGPHAGWAHQILFAGDLAQFKDKIAESQNSTKVKKRTFDQLEQDGGEETAFSSAEKTKPK